MSGALDFSHVAEDDVLRAAGSMGLPRPKVTFSPTGERVLGFDICLKPHQVRELAALLGIDQSGAAVPRQIWTDEQDEAIRDAGGKYAVMAALAADWGRSERHVISRWHLLRAQARGQK